MMQQCSVGPQLFHMNHPVFSSYTHTHTHRNTHTNRKPHTHTKSHTHTKPHTPTQTYTHTHIHTNPLRMQRGRTCHLKYLTDARLLNLIYPIGQGIPKKPARIMLQNTNLMYAIYPIQVDKQEAMETFFVNTMWKDHQVNTGTRDCNFLVDERLKFRIVDAKAVDRCRFSNEIIYARYNTEIGKDNQIPLWLFGFLY